MPITAIRSTAKSSVGGSRLSAARVAKESGFHDDMIRIAHRTGVSIRQLADVSGLGRKTVTSIVSSNARLQD